MHTIRQRHELLYTPAQNNQLVKLLNFFIAKPIYVCDIDTEIDLGSPYYRTSQYPDYAGGDNYFNLGGKKSLKILWWTWRSEGLVGEIKWTFNEDGGTFKKITLIIYPDYPEIEIEAKNLIAPLGELCNCEVTFVVGTSSSLAA